MKKHTPGKWESLEGEGAGELQQAAAVPDANAPPSKSVYSVRRACSVCVCVCVCVCVRV